ncbi:MAG TPA: polyphosphate polymerase domain-containing protein [Clostridia bacterium]|nr:polyphosphate polymerase domain-containing protein [Clostridia bacterium]HQM96483.1 polyphosphate polymerase domain-containing protein [Clostridia bacterium]
MNNDYRYRHELKYDINYSTYLTLRSRLRQIMYPDEHAASDGKYLIRSIYFDNYRDKALQEKLCGNSKHEKFRIRWYNDDLSFIRLEKKQKINGLCIKIDADWSETELKCFIDGDYSWMLTHPCPLTQELYVKMKTDQLVPRVIVSYLRESFIYDAGNIRITFDTDIRSTPYSVSFISKSVMDIGVTNEPGHVILEIKYDEFLPDIISCMIQLDNCRQIAYSKYSVSRSFG